MIELSKNIRKCISLYFYDLVLLRIRVGYGTGSFLVFNKEYCLKGGDFILNTGYSYS